MAHSPMRSSHVAPTPFSSYSTTVKCVVGSGLLSLPFAFAQAGWMVAIAGLALVCSLGWATMTNLIDSAELSRSISDRRKQQASMRTASDGAATTATYGSVEPRHTGQVAPSSPSSSSDTRSAHEHTHGFREIAFESFGVWGESLVSGVLLFGQLGCGVAFLSVVLANTRAVLADSFGLLVAPAVIALAVLPVQATLCLFRSTAGLARASHLGNLALLGCVGVIFHSGIVSPTSRLSWPPLSWEQGYSGSPRGVLAFLGVASFSFSAHAEIASVAAEASSRGSYARTLALSLVSVLGLYGLVGSFGLAAFGAHVQANVLLDLDASSGIAVDLVRALMATALVVNFALAVFPASAVLDLVFLGSAPPSSVHAPRGDTGTAGEGEPLIASSPEPQPPTVRVEAVSVHDGPNDRDRGSNGFRAPDLDDDDEDQGPSASALKGAHFFASSSLSRVSYHARGSVLRVLMVVACLVIAVLVDNLGVLLSVVGSVAGGMLCFTLPSVFWWRLNEINGTPLSNANKSLLAVQIGLGLALVTAGLAVIFGTASDAQ